MKTLQWSFILLFIFSFTSCLPDEDLPDGGGNNDLAAKFLGTWHVYEPDKKLNYDVTIKRYMNSETEVVLENFADVGSAYGLCVNNTIVLDNQAIGNGYTIEGTGTYVNKNKLEFTYLLDDGIDQETHTATFTKE
jgi:hypothetical protein